MVQENHFQLRGSVEAYPRSDRSLLQRSLNVAKNLPLRGFTQTVPRLNDNLQIRANCATWRATVFRVFQIPCVFIGRIDIIRVPTG